MQLAAMGQPVSVCHQWSMTGTRRYSSAQCSVSGSQRSPARKSVRKRERSCLPMCVPCGSSFLMARKAVDAVLGGEPPEGARVGSADRLALVEDGSATLQERRVDDIGVADDPADV